MSGWIIVPHSTHVHAGRISPNASRCARATASHWDMSARYTPVFTTWPSSSPSWASASDIVRIAWAV
jgi:hypothetical protein